MSTPPSQGPATAPEPPAAPVDPARPPAPSTRGGGLAGAMLRNPTLGPLVALVAAIIAFSLTTDTFLDLDNISLVVQQSLVIATLALGQTLIILTAGIDLANGAIMVLGTLLMAKLATQGMMPLGALLLGIVVCTAVGAISGGLVTRLRLPPFIVTLGLLTVVTAIGRLYSEGNSWPVTSQLLGWLGTGSYLFGYFYITPGMALMVAMFALCWYALAHTAWGRHVYAVGNDPEAARLTGIGVNRTIFSVYVVAGVIYGIAAW